MRVTQIPITVDFADGAPPCCCGEPEPPPNQCEGGWCRWIVSANPPGSNSNKSWVLSATNQLPCRVGAGGNELCDCEEPLEDANDYPEYGFGNWTCTDPITLIEFFYPP